MLFTTNLFNVTAKEAIARAAATMSNVDNKYFTAGTYIIFAAGEAVPVYDKDGNMVGTAKVEGKPMSGKDIATTLDKSPALVSRMLKAMRLILKAGDYTLFNNGTLKFQMDKVIAYYDNRDKGGKFENKAAADVLGMSVSEIEQTLKPDNTGNTAAANNGNNTAAAADNMVTFTYNGTEYSFKAEVIYNALIAADIIK